MTQAGTANQDRLYAEACATLAPALARLARSVERDADRARDLEQDIHLAIWRSFAGFDGGCALGTWVYRVAHNVAASHAGRGRRSAILVDLDQAETLIASDDPERRVGEAQTLERLRGLIAGLKPADRTVILLYLEGIDTNEIADVTGLSISNVSVKIHRIKTLLGRHFAIGDPS